MPRLVARPGLDVIGIHGLELDCIVGIRPHERVREQRVRIELGLGADTRHAAREARIGLTVDYGQVSEQLMKMLQFRRYHLIEAAAEELSAMLLATHPILLELTLRIEKPGALEGRAQAASVEVFRRREDFDCLSTVQQKHLKGECTVLQTRDVKLSLTTLEKGQQRAISGSEQSALGWLLEGRARCSLRSTEGNEQGASAAQSPDTLPRASGIVGSESRCPASEHTGSELLGAAQAVGHEELLRDELLSAGQFFSSGRGEQCALCSDTREPTTLFLCELTEEASGPDNLSS